MKPKKGANAIKKDKKETKAKNDYDELRALLKLDLDIKDGNSNHPVSTKQTLDQSEKD